MMTTCGSAVLNQKRWELFGIADQLLAAIALTVATTLLIKVGKLRWAWVTGIPLVWDVAVTFTAGWQKIFDSNPKIGFSAQRELYADALNAGKVLAPAKSLDDMETVVLNSTVDGVIMVVFLILVTLVIGHAAVICVRAVRSRGPLPTTETPHVESTILVPADRSEALVGAGIGPTGRG